MIMAIIKRIAPLPTEDNMRKLNLLYENARANFNAAEIYRFPLS